MIILAMDVSGSMYRGQEMFNQQARHTVEYLEGLHLGCVPRLILFSNMGGDADVNIPAAEAAIHPCGSVRISDLGSGAGFEAVTALLGRLKEGVVRHLYVTTDGWMDIGEEPDYPVTFFIQARGNQAIPFGTIVPGLPWDPEITTSLEDEFFSRPNA